MGYRPRGNGAGCCLDVTLQSPPIFIPFKSETLFNLMQYARGTQEVVAVYLEKVGARPQNSRSSCFTFGENVGVWKGILMALDLRYTEVCPTTWMSTLRCLTKGDKRVSLNRAKQLFPKISKEITHQKADALLIACYGLIQYRKSILKV